MNITIRCNTNPNTGVPRPYTEAAECAEIAIESDERGVQLWVRNSRPMHPTDAAAVSAVLAQAAKSRTINNPVGT